MIDSDQIYRVAKELYKRASLDLPTDVLKVFKETTQEESGRAREAWDFWWSQYDILKRESRVICPDLSIKSWFITIGSNTFKSIDTEIDWWGSIAKATAELTKGGFLMLQDGDVITGEYPNTNVGPNMPYIQFNTARNEGVVEMTAAPKGGGGEAYSLFRKMLPADGLSGIKKLVLDGVIRGATGGKTCPPNIVGVGIGGCGYISMEKAWEAATLRPIGSRNPIKWVAQLEDELLQAINELGIGQMGQGGSVTAFDVHAEFTWGAMTGIYASLVPQCSIIHRATAQISPDGKTVYKPYPELWFKESRRSISEYKKYQ